MSSQNSPCFSFVELVVEPEPEPVEIIALHLTQSAVLYVRADIDLDVVAVLADAICAC